MCGVWGYCFKARCDEYGKAIKPDTSVGQMLASFNLINSRGPEHSRFDQMCDNVYLGFKRLAINDPHPTGHQPFYHPTIPIVIVCN